jgi:hypothetical protein
MASPAVLEAMRKHVRHDSYPLLAVSMVRELKGGPLTAEEFAKLKALAMQRMASMVTAPDSAQQELDRQDQGIASKGGTLKRTNEGMDFGGFFTYTREQPSFTYLVTRSTVMTEAGASERTCEVNAASMLFWHGRMLGLSVIDHCAGTPKDARATSITHTWLTTFESLNPGGSSQHR